jgi:tetratricopeptide (TPR) repeat protein
MFDRHQSSRIYSAFIFCGFALLVLINSDDLRAQGGIDLEPRGAPRTGMGGNNSVEGQVLDPSGRPYQGRMRVVLSGTRGDLSTMTNDNGEFIFRRLPTGLYQLTVEAGEKFQPVYQSVDVRSIMGGRRNVINVDLRYRESKEAKPGVIDVALPGVPKDAVKLYLKARESQQKGDVLKAVEQLKAALAIHPTFVAALNELGVQYIGLERLDEAGQALAEALKIAPENVRLRADLGLLLMQKNLYADAEEQLRWVVARDDKSARTRLYLGRTLIGLRNYDEAEKELREAIRLGDQSMSVAHRFLAAIYIERGELEKAAGELEAFLRIDPQDKNAGTIRDTIKQLKNQIAQKP